MHEMAMCDAIVDTVTGHAGTKGVHRVQLRVGAFRQVVPDALQFCWTMRVDGTPLDGCELVADIVPARVTCHDCETTTTLEDPIPLCGSCDGADVELISGEEFLIESIDVTEEVR